MLLLEFFLDILLWVKSCFISLYYFIIAVIFSRTTGFGRKACCRMGFHAKDKDMIKGYYFVMCPYCKMEFSTLPHGKSIKPTVKIVDQ